MSLALPKTSHPSSNAGVLIQQYYNQLSDLRRVSGTSRETVVREAFKDLLKGCARSHDLVFVPEYEIITPAKERRYVDGALVHTLRVPFGHWEAKDEKDDLDAEIEYKFKRGYPQDNIIFEDSRRAVLIQDRGEAMRCEVEDVDSLQALLARFFGHERKEFVEFRRAIEQFKADLPAVLKALREMIEVAERQNHNFLLAARAFLEHAQRAINPSLNAADVREMLIQHVLTEEVFAAVFPGTPFHQDNNVARELYKLESTFFTGNTKYHTLKAMESYYAAIRAGGAQISSHHEKQTFLKVLYENFYKVYNPKAADRLGVVYTPNEAVRFMIESADVLCKRHFKRNLIDEDVQILDPATGTGTFICELLEHFRGQPDKLNRKYRKELHANEVAILPYYVANLNIEATRAALMGDYEEFPGLCFVDTLDNTFALRKYSGHQEELFGISDINVQRIRDQNARRISVIIGNPPYNANQSNENDNNKNRDYEEIDKRIYDTYIENSKAQKTKLYDPYARFFRWATDRLDKNGIVAFITNRSFIHSRTFDGFRKVVADEFNEIWVLDLGGDVRANGKLSGTKHNVFGIQTGVAITFLVRRETAKGCKIYYSRRPEMEMADAKLAFLGNTRFEAIHFDEITPDDKNNWLNISDNDFDTLIPLATKATKLATTQGAEKAVFKMFSLGIVTNRDDWAYADDDESLTDKIKHFCGIYESERKRWEKAGRPKDTGDFVSREIKWTSELEAHMKRGTSLAFDKAHITESLYRPFVKRKAYFARVITHRPYQNFDLFPGHTPNLAFSVVAEDRAEFALIATKWLPNKDIFLPSAGQVFALYRFDAEGTRIDNITDWGVRAFRKRYEVAREKSKRSITKEAIFQYIYGALHDPIYREKYSFDLKRELPRIPLHADFWQWADWGHRLLELHIGYETAMPFKLKRIEATKTIVTPKATLKADKTAGRIVIDSQTTLTSIPREVWDYRLGNRSALEWILDQYKEKTPKDPTIREKFNTYQFAEYKEEVIDLLARVTTVSVETQKIITAMRTMERDTT